MTEASDSRTPRRRHGNGAPENGGAQQDGQRSGQDASQQKRSKKSTRSIKYVKIEKERPSLTRGANAPAQEKAHEKRRRRQEGAKRPDAQLKIIPLGGLDAIGKNMTVLECGNDLVLDDAGRLAGALTTHDLMLAKVI